MRIRNAKAKGGIEFRNAMRRRMRAIKNPQKMYNFAEALMEQGEGALAGKARLDLAEMGYNHLGQPIKKVEGGAAAAAPAPARPRKKAVRERKPAKPVKAGKGVQKGKQGAKHPMEAINTNIDLLKKATSDFDANVKSVKQMGFGQEGIGKAFTVKLADGSRGVYKPHNGTGLQRYAERGHPVRRTISHRIPEAAREMVAFEISNNAGFDVVPYIEKVNFNKVQGRYKGEGHVMAWVNGKEACDVGHTAVSRDVREDHPDLHRIAALDFITCNTDRHARNYMKGNDGRYYAIDNGLAVCKDQKTSEYRSSPHGQLDGHRIPREVRDEIKSIDAKEVAKKMKAQGFPKIDIDGTAARIKYLQGRTSWDGPRDDMRRVR